MRVNKIENVEMDYEGNKILVLGVPEGEQPNVIFVNSVINFIGTGNVVVIFNGAKLVGTVLVFYGNNALAYIKKTRDNNVMISSDFFSESTLFFDEGCSFTGKLSLSLSERSNIIVGEDCMFSFGIWIRTSDVHLIYDSETKNRVNQAASVIIGKHVWVGQNIFISKGKLIGSGAVLGANAVITRIVASNTLVGGNPVREIKQKIFWDRRSSHAFDKEESLRWEKYPKLEENHNYYLEDETRDETLKFVSKLNDYEALERVKMIDVGMGILIIKPK